MTNVVFNGGKYRLINGDTVWGTDGIGVLLLSVAPVGCFDPDLVTVADVLAVATTTECTGTGYTRKAMTCTAPAQDDASDWISFDSTDTVWTALTLTAAAVAGVIYDETAATDDDRYLLAIIDQGFPKGSSGGNLTLQWSTSGVIVAA